MTTASESFSFLAPPREEDTGYMRRALDEARRAYGRTSPNPMVGTVLVKEGRIIGCGHHVRVGLDHGEAAAFKDARERGHDPSGCVVYVNLEPCCVHGRTPPCTEACIDAGVSRVVAAMVDPDPRSMGQGLRRLHEAGIEVTCGVLEAEAQRLNAPFSTFVTLGRPHVTAKVAMSLDGKIATRTGESFPMTGEEARQAVHVLRDRVDAILVGRRTLALDDPRLTCRLPEALASAGGPRDPVRVVMDPSLSSPIEARLFHLRAEGLSEAPTLVAAFEDADADKRALLDALGVEVIPCPRSEAGRLDPVALLKALAQRGLCSLLVEGGGVTLSGFFEAGLVDAWIAHIAPVLVGGAQAPTALAGVGIGSLTEIHGARGPLRVRRLGQDIEIAAAVAGDVYGLD